MNLITAFGLGTVIYDGLEFGAFLELPKDSPCFFLLKGINPILHAAFAFFQMYFIYVSARVRLELDQFSLTSNQWTLIDDSFFFLHMLMNGTSVEHSSIQGYCSIWTDALRSH